jgi:2'-5' RNA ligase
MTNEASRSLRLFVACELPVEVLAGLARAQEDLRRAGAEPLRWARPEGIHVTLKFLGNVDPSRAGDISEALAGAIEPFELRVRPAGVGGFGGSRLRVVWAGLEGDIEGLAALAGRVEQALEPLGFPAERRPFAPHLTLARVPDSASSEERRRLADLIVRHEMPPQPWATLSQVSLVRSVMGRGGSMYQQVASFPGGKQEKS